jgi:hypothetical protein|tara:strand:+ start:373 stop:723 length:351 start_codon:yes stop_codon:yes gene_type:complete
MTVLKKQFDLGTRKIWVRQASGMERLRFETILAKTFRKFKHFGVDQDAWTDEQQEEFLVALEDAGAGMTDQLYHLVPACIIDEVDINLIDRDTIMEIYEFVRGDAVEGDGSIPLDS